MGRDAGGTVYLASVGGPRENICQAATDCTDFPASAIGDPARPQRGDDRVRAAPRHAPHHSPGHSGAARHLEAAKGFWRDAYPDLAEIGLIAAAAAAR